MFRCRRHRNTPPIRRDGIFDKASASLLFEIQLLQFSLFHTLSRLFQSEWFRFTHYRRRPLSLPSGRHVAGIAGVRCDCSWCAISLIFFRWLHHFTPTALQKRGHQDFRMLTLELSVSNEQYFADKQILYKWTHQTRPMRGYFVFLLQLITIKINLVFFASTLHDFRH